MAEYEYISSGEEEASQLFITQNSFREPDTQDLDNAVDYLGGLDDFNFSDTHVLNASDLAKVNDMNVNQFEMCEKIFDFTEGGMNNGWTVQTQEASEDPFVVTRNSDGQQFVVGEGFCEVIPEMKTDLKKDDRPSVPISLSQEDLKRFGNVVTDAKVDRSMNKRYLCIYIFQLLNAILAVLCYLVLSYFNLCIIVLYRYQKATENKIKWAITAYRRWMNVRNFQVEKGTLNADRSVPTPEDLIALPKGDIIRVLGYFVHEVRDKNGKEYNRDTLYDLMSSINSFFKQNGVPYSFIDDKDFFPLKNAIDNRMKDLSAEGLIAPRIKAVPLSVDEINILWEKNLLGDDTPEKLVDTLVLLNGTQFAMRAAQEHYTLKVGQINVYFDSDINEKYVFYEEYKSKCNQGGIASRGHKNKDGRCYENLKNPSRCLVRLHEKYVSLRPTSPKCSDRYYLRPLTNVAPDAKVWYTCQPRGRHKIEHVVERMCESAGFTGRRSNHSARAAAATIMYEQGMDEQLIQEKTGHRSIAVRSYKRTSNRQLKKVSDVLYGNISPQKSYTKAEPSATVSKCPSDDEESKAKCAKVEDTSASSSVVDGKGVVININLNVTK